MKVHIVFFIFVTLANVSIYQVKGANILAVLTVASPSHYLWNRALIIALAERGHNLTVISNDIDEKPIANITFINIKGVYSFIRVHAPLGGSPDDNVVSRIRLIDTCVNLICGYQLSTEGTKQLLNYPDGKIFDLIITEAEYAQCFWPFISKFGNPPVVVTSGTGLPRRVNYMTGTPKNPAYTPDHFLHYSDKMNFMQRLETFVTEIISQWIWNFEHLPTLREIASRHFDFPVPDLREYERNFSVVLSNTVFGYDPPRPVTPNVVPIGGMHLKPPKPLTKTLQKFLDEAKDGAIFFSLGTNMNSSNLPAHVLQTFLDVFADLPQRVLWKFEADSFKHVPSNVMLQKWLPQSDILAHKNLKLFITHGGLMSSQEAVYYGVPTIGIPFVLDQHKNTERASVLGIGIGLPFSSINKETLSRSISQVLTNARYAENARRMSAIFRDQTEHPLDRAVFWVEYVLRHGGAPHLRTAAVDMPLYQYLLLDVLVALLAVLALAVLLLTVMLRWLWRRLQVAAKTKAKIKTN